ncbi:MAG: SMP-30/gluconolactonase/LRE family protein [Minicystis sp.]
MIRSLLSLAACATLGLAAGSADAKHHTFGEGALVSTFTNPGFPEGIVVDGSRYYVAGPANFDQTAVAIRAYNKSTGALAETIPVTHPGADPADALSCITTDDEGRLYVVSEAQGIVRLTKHGHTWKQELYAPLPADGLPGCVHGAQLVPDFTDPMMRVGCHLLNDLAFDEDGRLYVTDSMRATIYRVDAGGGALEPWFTSPYLVGGPPFPIGANGVRVSPTGDELYFTVSTSPLPDVAGRGALYKLPLVDAPEPEDLTVVHYYDPGLGPDGIAFGEDGEIYAALAFSNQVSILDPGGSEIARLNGPTGSSVPYDAPANIAFDGKGSLLVTNHALLSGDTSHMGVLRVFVGDRGEELFKPDVDGHCHHH